jgi:hypothetical protein
MGEVPRVSPWAANLIGLALVAAMVSVWGLALLWRIGSWHVSPAAALTFDEGLQVGEESPEVACVALDGTDRHLSFGGATAFLVFGTSGCRPCEELLHEAVHHPATAHMRRVYITNAEAGNFGPEITDEWELYHFEDETNTRDLWRAPVSPYFHVIDQQGRIAEKGLASHGTHLDRLLALRPAGATLRKDLEEVRG